MCVQGAGGGRRGKKKKCVQPRGVWECLQVRGCVRGELLAEVGGPQALQNRLWREQLLDRLCIISCSASAAPLGPGFSKGPLGYTPYSHHLSSTQADFLKMSSAFWWQAEAVTGVEELGNWVSTRGLTPRTPVSGEAAQHWLPHGQREGI